MFTIRSLTQERKQDDDQHYDPKEVNAVAIARESFSGRYLTDSQFDEAMAITGIIEREITKSGAFKEKLGDYAYAMARTEKLDAMKAENTIRDLFKSRVGQSMNQMREGLMAREEKLTGQEKAAAYDHAMGMARMIRDGIKMPFHRAYAHQAQGLAQDLGITDAGAKSLMQEAFRTKENRELYDWGKELEDRYYRPQIEAEKKEREQGRTNSGSDADLLDTGTSETARSNAGRPRQRSRSGPRP